MRLIIILFILSILIFGCASQQSPVPQQPPASQPTPTPTTEPPKLPQPPADQPIQPTEPPQPLPPKTPEPAEPKQPPLPPPQPKPPKQPPAMPPQIKTEQIEEVIPGKGLGQSLPDQGGDNGPWKHRIKSATSKDGLTWAKDNFALADQASVPDAIIDKDGNIRVYYVDWKNRGVTVAINANSAWKYYRVKLKQGFVGADPDVVLTNGVYRIYYTNFESPGAQLASIDVAFSDNGIIFENQTVAYAKEQGSTDADIFIANKWIMFISNGPRNIMATSSDGLKFTKQDELPFMGSVSNTIKVSNGYRMYYHKSSGMQPKASIYSAFSSDGTNWQEEGLRLEASTSEESVESPAVVKLPDGDYKMFYHSIIND